MRLEIGPGRKPIEGFVGLNIVPSPGVDIVADARGPIPVGDNSVELIYASHILEHIPWYQTLDALREWLRILQPGGVVEIWVPDALKIARTLVEFEEGGIDRTWEDGWYRFNPDRDPCVWAAGRTFAYGDGKGTDGDPNWHRALFTPRYLKKVLSNAGFSDVTAMDRSEVRGDDHGWINLGMRGFKP